ncbi:hypothetical protein ARMSODRAFT_981600 [Armillaria solidipes]|uniref:Uncharacterized protein n=1 Tax=Armillaria solidipes TaxID=1076256 RepID=A0A2H3BDX7_9AGAR|nr:hypothetical protein ARMSODRAFT_981600 [Armillaria solidipes]
MRFSVAALIPLAALAVPVLSTSVQARDDSYDGVDYKGKDRHNDGGSKDYNYGNKDHGRKDCTWEPVFENKKDFKGWNKGKYTPYEHKEVDKITFEIECKSFCEKDDKCNSCQGSFASCSWRLSTSRHGRMTDDDKDRKDGKGRKDGKKDDKDHKYYDTSCWNAHYNY